MERCLDAHPADLSSVIASISNSSPNAAKAKGNPKNASFQLTTDYQISFRTVLIFLLHSKQYIQDLQDRLSKVESLLPLTFQDEKDRLVESKSLQSQSLLLDSSTPPQVSTPLGLEPNAPAGIVDSADVEARPGETALIGSNLFQGLGHYWHQVAQRLRSYTLGDPVSLQEPEVALIIMTIGDISAELPLFHIPSFTERIRRQHTVETCNDPSWLACIHALMALIVWRRMANRSFSKMSVFVWSFFRKAYASLPGILQQGNDLAATQALLVMEMFMSTSADFRTTSLLSSAVCRAIQTTCRWTGSAENMISSAEKDTRNRVFWIAFILETETSISYGIPSMLTEDDLDIDLPAETSQDGCGLVALEGEQRHINTFRMRAELAIIQSRVQAKLYGAKSLKQTGSHLLKVISELHCQLDGWRLRIPSEVRPEFGGTLKSSMRDTSLVNLHFMYFNCVSMIHWTALRQCSWQADRDTTRSIAQCRATARSTISLLIYLPSPQILALW
jgi:hypothetical protein